MQGRTLNKEQYRKEKILRAPPSLKLLITTKISRTAILKASLTDLIEKGPLENPSEDHVQHPKRNKSGVLQPRKVFPHPKRTDLPQKQRNHLLEKVQRKKL